MNTISINVSEQEQQRTTLYTVGLIVADNKGIAGGIARMIQ